MKRVISFVLVVIQLLTSTPFVSPSNNTNFKPDSELVLEPCDIFFNRGNKFLSRAIRIFTRSRREEATVVNHVGLIVQKGTLFSAATVEALGDINTVRLHTLRWYARKKNSKVAIFRPLNLTPREKEIIVAKAMSFVDRPYGFGRILTHGLDWCLGGRYCFRRLTSSGNPTCSSVVAEAFAAADKYFDVDPPGAASPDCIWDFVVNETNKYQQIRELSPLSKEE